MKGRNGSASVAVVVLFFCFFILYFLTLCPTLYWRDAGEFISASFELGVAHPAGSPLYLQVAKLFTLLPFASIAFRVNLLSAFFGASIVPVVFLIVRALLDLIEEETRFHSVCALFTAAVFGVSGTLWDISVQTEVYTLQHFLFGLILLLILGGLRARARERGDQTLRFVCTIGFLSGLAMGAHVTFFFYFPAIALACWWIRWRETRESVQEIPLVLFFFILGGSIYLYLPLRASTHPYFNWGEPETFRNFLIHVTDRKDSKVHFNLPVENLPGQFSFFANSLLRQFSVFGIPLIAAGGYRLWKRSRFFLVFLGIMALPNFVFFIRYWSNGVAFVPTFFCLVVLFGVGLQTVLSGLMNSATLRAKVPRALLQSGAGVILAGIILSLLSLNVVDNDKHRYWWARDFSKSLYSEMANDAIVFSQVYFFELSYMNQIEQWRPDVTVINKSDFYAPDYFQKVRKRRFPKIVVPVVQESFVFPDLINMNLQSHPIYWEPNSEDDSKLNGHLLPDGYLYRVYRNKVAISPSVMQVHNARIREQFERALAEPTFMDDDEGVLLYESVFTDLGSFFVHQNRYLDALKMYKLIALLNPKSSENLNNLGLSFANMRYFSTARTLFEESLRLNSHNLQAQINLGHVYLETGAVDQAESYLKRVVHQSPDSAEAHFQLGTVLEREGRDGEARKEYRLALEVVTEPQTIENIRAALSRLSGRGGSR